MFLLYLHLLILTLKLIDPSTSANQQLSDTTSSTTTIIATTTFIIIVTSFEALSLSFKRGLLFGDRRI